MEFMPGSDAPVIPQIDLVRGHGAGGRVTLWAVRCSECAGYVGKPGSKAFSEALVRQHYSDHRTGKV